jgi:hypothetical protein
VTQSTRIPYSLFFSHVGYITFSVFLAAAVVEVGATILRSAHHWIDPVNAQSLATSPPYQGYPWAQAFWNEEFLRRASAKTSHYVPSDLGRTTLAQQFHQRR